LAPHSPAGRTALTAATTNKGGGAKPRTPVIPTRPARRRAPPPGRDFLGQGTAAAANAWLLLGHDDPAQRTGLAERALDLIDSVREPRC
jgi:hypothetical protein